MKTKTLFIYLCATLLLFHCKSDDDNGGFDGSLRSIEDFYNEDVVEALDDLGFNINTGNTPPNLEGTYLISPYELKASTVESDVIGRIFANNLISFSNQNNASLTVDYRGVNGTQEDNGDGSFISGENNEFSIFLKLTSQINESVIVDTAYAISGILTNNGIEQVQVALLMLDDKGDPDGVYIANNTGRLFIDSDGLSPKQ